MPVLSRAIRGPKSEEMLRRETLVKIDARKARIAAATAKLLETPISNHKFNTLQRVAVPVATEHNSAGTTAAKNSETAVAAASLMKDLEGGEGAKAVPATVSVRKGIFCFSATLNPSILWTAAISRPFTTPFQYADFKASFGCIERSTVFFNYCSQQLRTGF